MSFISIRDLQKFVSDDTNIDSYLDRVAVGSSDVYRSTFYRDKDPNRVLDDWERRLCSISHDYPTLLDFENDLRKKVGPMSVMKPLDDRLEDVDSYYTSIGREAKPLDPRAVSASLQEWESVRGDSIVCRSQRDTVLHMKLSTNSGTPYFTRRSTVVEKTIPCSLSTVNTEEGLMFQLEQPDITKLAAAIIGWRGQEGGPEVSDVKQRVVWMFPFGVNVLEQTLYQPLIQSFQRHKLVPAWISNDYVDAEITQLFDTKDPKDLVICTDFSKFDQHFNPTLASTAHDLIEGLIRSHPRNASWLEDVFPVKYSIPMILSRELVTVGKHGMGSGSGGTNFDETLVHRTLQHEAACMSGCELNIHSQCLGDDGIICYPGVTVDDVIRCYTQHGLEMNPDKQYAATDHCVYLRRWHHQDYRPNGKCAGVYSTYRALGRLMYQERYYDPKRWGPKMVALRQLSIIENVKYHPLREEFAEYCMRGDRYRLGIDIPGFLSNIKREAQEAIDLMPDFLGYNRTNMESDTSIDNWWIVNYLRNHR